MFDRRIIFIGTFFFTLFSTILVAFVSFATEQGMLYTVLYSLATMWITGVISQVLLQNLYQGIVKPLEEVRVENRKEEKRREVNLQEVEAIDDAMDRVNEAMKEPASERVPTEV
jgi:uncharacterized membrane-anchored protein YitT (DUF2179 family)